MRRRLVLIASWCLQPRRTRRYQDGAVLTTAWCDSHADILLSTAKKSGIVLTRFGG